MLFHELQLLFPSSADNGVDELYDTTSVAGYTFYGIAPLGTAQNAALWRIVVYRADGTATRYYPPNQNWSLRSSLSLP